jgi:hypothetical protein
MTHRQQGITPAANRLLFDYTLPPGVLVSYLRLLSLAQDEGGRQAGPLEFSRQVAPLLGIKASQAHAHLRALRMAKLLTWTQDGDGRYIFFFNNPELPDSTAPPVNVVLDVDKENKYPVSSHQQQQNMRILLSKEVEALLQRAEFAEVMGWLARAGVWTDRAIHIARQILANEALGKPYLPGRSDVLGWIAFSFAFQRQNKIEKPAQLLAANLLNNRCCPKEVRPPRICAGCHFEEGYCQCHGEPQYGYPEAFIDFAFQSDYNPYAETFWGVCRRCRGFPCQCPDVELDDENDDE